MEAGSKVLYLDFPNFSSSLLENLNQQRMEGKFCDISIQVQGKVFQAHRAVLAASSPYFHDQVLFRNASRLSLPGVMDARAFESILASCYAGRLAVMPADIVSYLTVGSFLQMWHVVDKCTELLREREPPPAAAPGPRHPGSQSPSSSNYFSPREELPASVSVKPDETPEDELLEDEGVDPEQKVTSNQEAAGRQPRHGGWVLVKEEKVEGEEEEEEGEEEEEEEEELEDDDLVLTCEEDDHHFVKGAGGCRPLDPRSLSISGVCTLTRPLPPPLPLGPPGEEEAADFCGSTEDFPYDVGEEGPQCFAPVPSLLLLPGGGGGPQELRHGAAGSADPAGGGPGGGGGGGGKMFACHCGKSFTHRSQRDRHVNMHLNLRPFACTLCNKKFKMKHHLVEHMKIHTGHKPFQCHVCAKKFMWRDSFLRHRAACEKLQRDIPLSRGLD